MSTLLSGEVQRFQSLIYDYFRVYGRDFPWRRDITPYRVLLSEFMLQQTQVGRVKGYFDAFTGRFPTVQALAEAPLAAVITLWQGLGYNRRAKHLWRAARLVVDDFGGLVPSSEDELQSLPGVGPYTAAAIRAFAFDLPAVVLDTNIRRVYLHFFFPDDSEVHDREIRPVVARTMDPASPRRWYYALMDYGAVLARWFPNPNRRSAHYRTQSPFENSSRQIRGSVLRHLTIHGEMDVAEGPERLAVEPQRLADVLDDLEAEGFLRRDSGVIRLA